MKNKPIFPESWGNEPIIQARDRVKLPSPYESFYGSSSLASWIKMNQKTRRTSSAGIVIKSGDKYLICRSTNVKSKGREVWGFPKGRVEKGESIEDAAIRETFEETGIKVDEMKFLCCYYTKKKRFYFYITEMEIDPSQCFCESLVDGKDYPENDKFMLATFKELGRMIDNHMIEVVKCL